MCEYHYRKGVYEATMEPDSVEAQKYAADDDGYMTIRRFGKPTLQVKIGRDWRIHVDAQISTMHIVYCENLALYFRSSPTSEKGIIRAMLCIMEYYYRKGIKHGLERRDSRAAHKFFAEVGRGKNHPHWLDNKKDFHENYIDKMKQHINTMGLYRKEWGQHRPLRLLESNDRRGSHRREDEGPPEKKEDYGNSRPHAGGLAEAEAGDATSLGEWKNQKLLEESETEVADKEGNVATIISKAVLTTNNPVTDAISWMLYGYSIADIRRRMELKWPLKNDKVLFLVVEPK